MLRDPYYTGIVIYKGDEYPGRHEPLIDADLFNRVQALLASCGRAGERRRIVHHYLKGTLWCGDCYDAHGTFRRMIARRTISRAGDEYFYFFCIGNNDGTCNSKYINMLEAERAVENHYRHLNASPAFINFMSDTLDETLADQQAAQKALRDQLTSQLTGLNARETNLIDLASDGTLPQQKIRARLQEIAKERERITTQLDRVQDDLDEAATFIKTPTEEPV